MWRRASNIQLIFQHRPFCHHPDLGKGHRLCLSFEDTLERSLHTRKSSNFLPFNALNYSPKFCGILKNINTQFYIHRVLLFIFLMEWFFFLPNLLIHQENFIDKNNSSFSQQLIHLQNGFQFALQTIENFLLYFFSKFEFNLKIYLLCFNARLWQLMRMFKFS